MFMSNTIEHIISLFHERPYLIKMGAKKIAKQLSADVQDVRDARRLYRSNHGKGSCPRILVFDIETAPLRAYVWNRWRQNIGLDFTITEWFMLGWSAKWLGEDHVYSEFLYDDEAIREDDRRIVESLREILNKADIVISFNGKKFDQPYLNTRCLTYGLPPIHPYREIDLYEIAKKQFKFSSSSLNAICRQLGLGSKDDVTWANFKGAVEGNLDDLFILEDYCCRDTELTEQLYYKMRPWIKGHANLGVYMSDNNNVCTACGSSKLKEERVFTTNTGKFVTYRCEECGAVSRSRFNVLPKEAKENLLTCIPR